MANKRFHQLLDKTQEITKEITREIAPERSAIVESFGFGLVGLGLFFLVSLVSYDPTDWSLEKLVPEDVSNVVGPLGATVSHIALEWYGLVSLVWAIGLMVWGGLMALGFIRRPKFKRWVAFFLITLVLSAFMHIMTFKADAGHLPAGFGGLLGAAIGDGVYGLIGFGGSFILLCFAGLASMILTGNLKLSNTAEMMRYGIYHMRRALKTPNVYKDDSESSAPAKKKKRSAAKKKKAKAAPQVEEDLEDLELPEEPVSNLAFVDFTANASKITKAKKELFKKSSDTKASPVDHETISRLLEEHLGQFKVSGKIVGAEQGPVVTTYEFEPDPGTKVSKVVGLADDLSRLLKSKNLRILAPIPGKNVLGFEIPNQKREMIRFGDVLHQGIKELNQKTLPVVMGSDTYGNAVIEDLAEMPHLLIAGSTGSGKSVFINTLVAGLLCKNTAKELKFVMIDPKMIELAAYEKLPHLACPVVTDPATEGKEALETLVQEMEHRYRMMGTLGVRNIKGYNEIIKTRKKIEFPKFEGKWQPLPYVVLLIDEFADMMMVVGKEAEAAIARLAQKARAAGIHLIIATQRPSVNVVTGFIKANFTTRISFRVLSGVDSRTILDETGAETLLGKGDLLYQSASGTQRLHAAFLEDAEVTKLVKSCA